MACYRREEDRTRSEAFNTRMQLEEISRKTLKELTLEFERKAWDAMQKESSTAVQQNQTLREQLSHQNVEVHSNARTLGFRLKASVPNQITSLMQRHESHANTLNKARMSRTLLEQKTQMQKKRLESLESLKRDHEDIIKDGQVPRVLLL